MSFIRKFLFSALLAPLLGGPGSYAAEFEVLDRFSVDGYSVLRGSADIPGGSFAVGGSTFAVNGGNVGIGTTGPAGKLNIVSDGSVGYTYLDTYGSGLYSKLRLRAAGGSFASPAAIQNGDLVGELGFQGYDGTVFQNAAIIHGVVVGAPSGSHIPTALRFSTDSGSSLGERMRIDQNGNVGIGTISPQNKLHVIGTLELGSHTARPSDGQINFGNANESWIGLITSGRQMLHLGGMSNGGSGSRMVGIWDDLYVPGNVGIGTTAPGEKLTVTGAGTSYVAGITTDGASQRGLIIRNAQTATTSGGTGPSIYVQNTSVTANNFASLAFAGAVTSIGYISGQITDHANSYGNLVFTTRGSDGWNDRVIITSTGNVGIGTANPAATLDVGGTAAIKLPVGTTTERPASPVTGMLRFNTTTRKIEFFDGTSWFGIGSIVAAGGTITDTGGYRIHTFTGSGTFTVTSGGSIEVLVVAGGGGGGAWVGGGGGAGGLVYSGNLAVTPGAYSVVVGAGGIGSINPGSYTGMPNGSRGGNSSFPGLTTAIGGGMGASHTQNATHDWVDGGSGGGNSGPSHAVTGLGTSGQGNNGGIGYNTNPWATGGGGGAGAAGSNYVDANTAGNGGAGIYYPQFTHAGYPAGWFSGGGGGGKHDAGGSAGTGGNGGGGNGLVASTAKAGNGVANTGGGGGGNGRNGGERSEGGDGGSGIVIIRYPN